MTLDDLVLPVISRAPSSGMLVECKDGIMLIQHIAKAARVTTKVAMRAVSAHCDRSDDRSTRLPDGARLEMDESVIPSDYTRAEMGKIIARKLGIGIYGRPSHDADRPTPEPVKEKPLGVHHHPYNAGKGGRSISSRPEGGFLAKLTCRCGNHHSIQFRQLAGCDQIDTKFRRAGWRLDPAKCPACINPIGKAKPEMSAKPSPAAIKSQALMFRLLGENFDGDTGRYAEGWSDDRVAKEAAMSADTVAAFREEAFGILREPEEIAALARDIATFETMMVEAASTVESLKTEVRGLKDRLEAIRRKFN